jgi:hypothetical protein
MDTSPSLLKALRQGHPTASYVELADHTGIQVSRVFRLYKGAPMRLEEFQKILHALPQNRGHPEDLEEFYHKSIQCLIHLEAHKLRELTQKLHQALQWKRIQCSPEALGPEQETSL